MAEQNEDAACRALEELLILNGYLDFNDDTQLAEFVSEVVEAIKNGEVPGVSCDFPKASAPDLKPTGLLPVEGSSNVTACGWDNGVLAVQFKGGAIYHYLDVPVVYFEEIMKAESFGRYLNSEIKPRFKFEKQ